MRGKLARRTFREDKAARPGTNTSLQPADRAVRRSRRRLGWRHELVLALLPTLTMLAVLGLVEAFNPSACSLPRWRRAPFGDTTAER